MMYMETTRSDAVLGRTLTTLVVLVGPYLTVMFLLAQAGSSWMRTDQLSLVLTVGLLAWSPLFFSLPALLTQDGRDRALPELDGLTGSLLRGALLVPWLILSPQSTVRLETAASLVGFAASLALALPHLTW